MLIHPTRPFNLESASIQGKIVTVFYREKTIELWNRPGAALSFLRKGAASHAIQLMMEADSGQIIWITDHPERFSEQATREGLSIVNGWHCLEPAGCAEGSISFMSGDLKSSTKPFLNSTRSSRKIALLSLQNRKDPRWRRMGLPNAAQLIMGSLKKAGNTVHHFQLSPEDLNLKHLSEFDFIAIGVYEDLIMETRQLIAMIKRSLTCPIILGGPMVTLASEYVAVHCHQADVLLRGEVEATFPELMQSMPVGGEEFSLRTGLRLCQIEGLFAHGPNWWVLADFDKIPTIDDFSVTCLSVDQFSASDVEAGLEYSTSRGCPRTCYFCSHVHGTKLRKYSDPIILRHLHGVVEAFRKQSGSTRSETQTFALNINDDDLLLDPNRALGILKMCREIGFKIWGIQTSIESLRSDRIRQRIFDEISRSDFFKGSQPLLWIGTDAFTSTRLHRLGKKGTPSLIKKICRDIDEWGFLGYHYWILTDADSDWFDFFEELQQVRDLVDSFPNSFHLLPNSATVIPYPSTRIYWKHINERKFDRIILKEILQVSDFPEFDYPVVLHERPMSNYLYALVEPSAWTSERIMTDSRRFINLLRQKKLNDAIIESLRVLSLEINMLTDLSRMKELNCLRERILSDWPTHEEFML